MEDRAGRGTAPLRLERTEIALMPVAASGGAGLALATLQIMATDDVYSMAGWSFAMMGALVLMAAPVVLTILRRRAWAMTAAVAPAGVALMATFGAGLLGGIGPAEYRPLLAWGSIALAAAYAPFSVYAHRDAIRRASSAT